MFIILILDPEYRLIALRCFYRIEQVAGRGNFKDSVALQNQYLEDDGYGGSLPPDEQHGITSKAM